MRVPQRALEQCKGGDSAGRREGAIWSGAVPVGLTEKVDLNKAPKEVM